MLLRKNPSRLRREANPRDRRQMRRDKRGSAARDSARRERIGSCPPYSEEKEFDGQGRVTVSPESAQMPHETCAEEVRDWPRQPAPSSNEELIPGVERVVLRDSCSSE